MKITWRDGHSRQVRRFSVTKSRPRLSTYCPPICGSLRIYPILIVVIFVIILLILVFVIVVVIVIEDFLLFVFVSGTHHLPFKNIFKQFTLSVCYFSVAFFIRRIDRCGRYSAANQITFCVGCNGNVAFLNELLHIWVEKVWPILCRTFLEWATEALDVLRATTRVVGTIIVRGPEIRPSEATPADISLRRLWWFTRDAQYLATNPITNFRFEQLVKS